MLKQKKAEKLILVAENEAIILKNAEQILNNLGYTVIAIECNEDIILKKIALDSPSLVIMDISLKDSDYIGEITDQIKGHYDIPVLYSTTYYDKELFEEIGAIHSFDYIIKPFNCRELNVAVDVAICKHEMEQSAHNSIQKIVNSFHALMNIKDTYTVEHSKRVSYLSMNISHKMGFNDNVSKGIKVMGMLHDIGKTTIPLEIINKPSPSLYEQMIIQTHSEAGYAILKEIDFPWDVSSVTLQHHERLDGSGFPYGLSDKKILPEARIISVADIVDHNIFGSPRGPGIGVKEGLDELKKKGGVELDDDAVFTCVEIINKNGISAFYDYT